MKAIIYVFSGTGNTRLVAEIYQKYLTEYETTIFDIKVQNTQIPDPNDFDLCGFAFPVHGFNAPKIFTDFVKKLPAIRDVNSTGKKKTFIFKTSGEGLTFNLYSSQITIRTLERKGFEIFTDHHFVMPYNMIFRHTPEMVKSEYIYADAQVRMNVKQLRENSKTKIYRRSIKAWFLPIFRIEWLYAQAQGPFMKVDTKKCINCQKCVKICPYQNIKVVDGKFKFGTHCALCVACSFNCPTSAISIGLLNGWKVNGDYKIVKTASDSSIKFPYFNNDLKGLKRWAYLKHFTNLQKELEKNNIPLQETDLNLENL